MFFSLDLTNELARQTPDGAETKKLKKESTVFSTVGNYVSGFYPHNPEVDLPNDAGRIAWIRWLIAEGYGERVLVLLASLTTGWAKDANTAVATAGLRFAHVQLRVFLDRSFPGDVLSGRPATGVTASAGVRALVSIATAATTRLTDRKAGPCASDCLHVAVELHSLRFGLAIIEPLAAAARIAARPVLRSSGGSDIRAVFPCLEASKAYRAGLDHAA